MVSGIRPLAEDEQAAEQAPAVEEHIEQLMEEPASDGLAGLTEEQRQLLMDAEQNAMPG